MVPLNVYRTAFVSFKVRVNKRISAISAGLVLAWLGSKLDCKVFNPFSLLRIKITQIRQRILSFATTA